MGKECGGKKAVRATRWEVAAEGVSKTGQRHTRAALVAAWSEGALDPALALASARVKSEPPASNFDTKGDQPRVRPLSFRASCKTVPS